MPYKKFHTSSHWCDVLLWCCQLFRTATAGVQQKINEGFLFKTDTKTHLITLQYVCYPIFYNLKKDFKSATLLSSPLLSSTKGEDFSNELPSSSSSSSLPSSPSVSSSSSSSSDLPHSSSLPHPESPLPPVTPGNLRLEVAAPHYHDDQLQVKVFWKWPNHGE